MPLIPAWVHREPRAPGAPVRVWRDWVLAAGLVVGAVVEVLVRDDVVWPPVAFASTIFMIWPILIRRQHPLRATALVFLTAPTLSAIAVLAGAGPVGLNAMAGVMPVAYSLTRWGSGAEVSRGLAVMVYAWAVGSIADAQTIGDIIGGFIFLGVVLEAGALVRMQARGQREALDQARAAEREQIARELHDSVAHHVSAIAVQAQAGRAVGPTNPQLALDTLAVIEQAASQTLAEMRTMVGSLRGDEPGEVPLLAPQRGVRDIPGLADATGADGPRVTVSLVGLIDALRPSVGTALYRLAQESVTNARRHAQHATQVSVVVDAEVDQVRLTVTDDGRRAQRSAVHGDRDLVSGDGMIGMIERTELLGGTLRAGPDPDGTGWRVDAVIPCQRVPG